MPTVTLCTLLAVAVVIAQQVVTLCGEQTTQQSSSLHSHSIPPGAAEVTTHKLSDATLRQSASTSPTCSIPRGTAKSGRSTHVLGKPAHRRKGG
jgi:hypothetical protein